MATLHHQVWIDAPLSKVYDALASAEGLGNWWAPHTSTQTSTGVVLAHNPGPEHGGDVKMKVLDTTRNKRIEWEIISTHPTSSPASAWTGTHIVFELSQREKPVWMSGTAGRPPTTVVEFRHEGWNEKNEYFGFCNFAWGETLVMLRQWCEHAA
jgi:uncharacterized protein YndB with AHSA1/START domain